jgi:hypothetical protein
MRGRRRARASETGNSQRLSSEFLERILQPYQPTGTDYLRSAEVLGCHLSANDSTELPLYSVGGTFRIPHSCYIRDTGHFNAVEFLICFNQLAYSTFGHMFASGLFGGSDLGRVPERCRERLKEVSADRFFEHQLSSMLILRCTTRFREAMSAREFTGVLDVRRVSLRNGAFLTDTRCVFRDRNGGVAEGEVLLAYSVERPAVAA